jgi:uncharacterized metal-binding protein YceD (DUF177 family)
MPDLARRSADNAEFARVLDVAHLREAQDFTFEISPEPAEAQAIARLMGAQAVRKLRFSGRLAPFGKEGWRLEGQLGATVIQTCVVTLEPMTTRVDQAVRRDYRPIRGPAGPSDILLSPEDDDEIEPLGRQIDLGLLAIETLALALPAYPRKPGAELERRTFAAEGVVPLGDAEVKPFAALAALKDKLSGES